MAKLVENNNYYNNIKKAEINNIDQSSKMSVIITVYVESDTCNNIRRNKPTTNPRSSINNNNAITNHHHQVRGTKPLLTKPTILSSSNKFPTLMPRSSHGFDRKAQLLAYAQELRQQYYNSKSINSWPAPMYNFPNNRPKTKWSWIKCPRVNYRSLLSRMFCRSTRQWRYRRIRSEDNININNYVKGSCRGSTKAQTEGSRNYYRRMRCMLKELACGWNCAKAGFGTMD